MLDHDLEILDLWVKPLQDSIDIWSRFATNSNVT
jgi:hypothetical protein